ncbi:hypothetical protein Agub_g11367, partial [Astrephomene gubernaculifera]
GGETGEGDAAEEEEHRGVRSKSAAAGASGEKATNGNGCKDSSSRGSGKSGGGGGSSAVRRKASSCSSSTITSTTTATTATTTAANNNSSASSGSWLGMSGWGFGRKTPATQPASKAADTGTSSANNKAGDGKESTGASSSNSAAAAAAVAKKSRKISGRCWMAEEFPIRLSQLLPVLQVVGTANKVIAKVEKFMRKYGDLDMFPVKVQVPLVLTVYVLLSFKQFRLLGDPRQQPGAQQPPGDDFFEVPPGYTQGTLEDHELFAPCGSSAEGARSGSAGATAGSGTGGDKGGGVGCGGEPSSGAREQGGGGGGAGAPRKLTLLRGTVMEDEMGLGDDMGDLGIGN